MKLKIFITAFVLLFINGCNSDSSPVSGGDIPIAEVSDSDTLEVDNEERDNSDLDNPELDNPDTDEPAVKVLVGWYMRTVAKATLSDSTEYIHKTAGIMGELKESLEGKDRHDIEAFGTPALSVVFLQEEGGDYFSDYRQFTADETRQIWTFQVKNRDTVDLTHAALQLTLEDSYTVYEVEEDGRTTYKEELQKDQSKKNNIILVDVDMQKEYSYEELEKVQLSMEGNVTRTFRWVLRGATTVDDYEPISAPLVAAQLTKTLSNSIKSAQAYDDKFGLPPQL